MPDVAILPPSSAFRFESSFPHTMQNGYPSHEESVAAIKERAKEKAFNAARGSSATSLMRVARDMELEAHRIEVAGDFRKAFEVLTQSTCLIQLLLNGPEYTNEEKGKKGALYKEVSDWMQVTGKNIMARTATVESKLRDLETSTAFEASTSPNGTGPKSIANRIASLQNAGLSVTSSAKRSSKESQNVQSPTPLPAPPMSAPNRLSLHTSLPPPQSPTLSTPTSHAFVPTSSLGPPSPSSSTSSSPRLSQFSSGSITEFTQQFPTIDELEEMGGLKRSGTGSSEGSLDMPPPNSRPGVPPPIMIPKPFPALPFDLGQRPSSTPIPTSIDTLISRPTSPTKSPLSPMVPRKPSNLSLNSPQKSPFLPSIPMSTPGSSPRPDRADLPKLPKSNMTTPKELHDYIHVIGYKVLLLDVRSREDFEKEHIKADAVVCLEPFVLVRESMTAELIEDSLLVGPRNERTLFTNRDKFDLVVIYDKSTDKLEPGTPVSSVFKAIYEMAFKKILKHTPMLLTGGLEAWREQFGDADVVRGVPSSITIGAPTADGDSVLSRVAAPPYSRTGSSTNSHTPVNGPDSATLNEDRVQSSLVSLSGPSRPPDASDTTSLTFDARRPPRKLPLPQPPSLPRNDPSFMVNGSSSIQYPSYPRNSPAVSPPIPALTSSPGIHDLVSLPPTASINPYPLSRRRSDYPDQSHDAVSGFNARPIDYPDLSSSHVLRPPPAAAASVLERQDNRPRLVQHNHSFASPGGAPKPPIIRSDYPVTYWSDTQIGISGLKNLGNTCYMNSTIQCLSATVPFSRFFTDGRWRSAVNMINPLGTKGNLAQAFASILHEMWQAEMPYLTPVNFRRSICAHASQFSGSDQHDSQEFLSFLLDGLHEDLNRILNKPPAQTTPEREAELERLPPQIASDQEWELYRSRNDSLIVDFFQGQFRNRLECLTCHKTSTTYNAFMYLSLPIPTHSRTAKVSLQACLDALVNKEVMEKSDAWNCPSCKTLRKATKQLSLSRLPPILLINLKRFSFKGPFTDKIESFVDFPMKGLDLTNYMPHMDSKFGGPLLADDPRAQIPPFRYDLYAVTNHFGSLSSGHYTAFVASRGGWVYCDDSKVTPVDAKEVVGKPAYVLYYKRTRA